MIVVAVVDLFEPPMSRKVTLEQTTKFVLSLTRSEPNRDYLAPQSQEALHEMDVSGTALLFSFGQELGMKELVRIDR